jgi:hypothetical protein
MGASDSGGRQDRKGRGRNRGHGPLLQVVSPVHGT